MPSYGGQGVAGRGREHDSGAAGGALSGACLCAGGASGGDYSGG